MAFLSKIYLSAFSKTQYPLSQSFNGDVTVFLFDFDARAFSSKLFTSHQRSAATHEGVKDGDCVGELL